MSTEQIILPSVNEHLGYFYFLMMSNSVNVSCFIYYEFSMVTTTEFKIPIHPHILQTLWNDLNLWQSSERKWCFTMLSICFSMVTNGLSKHSFPWFFFCFLNNDYSCLLSNFLLVLILICRLIYIFWIPILCQLCITILFSKFVFCLFTLFVVIHKSLYIKVHKHKSSLYIKVIHNFYT